MVVMRSPKQSKSRSQSQSQSQRGSSLQPSAAASTSPFVDGLTPRKGDAGLAGNKLLEQRIAESLQLVAASPSLKANAPWPFASSSKLRRSPPRSKLRPPAPSLRFETSVDAFDASNAILNEAEPALAAAAGPPVNHRNFEVAARALFDRKQRPVKARHSTPAGLASLDGPFSTGPRKQARARSSLADLNLERSIAILATPARQHMSLHASVRGSTNAGSDKGTPGVGDSPQSVKTLAKIGRLTARLAHLEAETTTAKSEVDALRAKYHSLHERYEEDKAEKASMQTRLDEYEGLADQCRDVLDEHEQLKTDHQLLGERLDADALKLADALEQQVRSKWKQKKLRGELATRREEGKWQEATEHHAEVKALQVALVALKAQNIDLELRLDYAESERDLHAAPAELLRNELTDLFGRHKTSSMDDSALRKALEEQVSKHHAERSELIERLDGAIRDREQAEKLSKSLSREVKLFEDGVAKDKARRAELAAAKTTIKELEKQLKAAQKENDKLEADREDLQTGLEQKETDLAMASAKSTELDKKLKATQKERADLQDGVNVQHKAIKALSTPPRSLASSPPQGRSKVASKRKRDRPEDNSEESPDELEGHQTTKAKKARTVGKSSAIAKAARNSSPAISEAGHSEVEEAEADIVEKPTRKRGRPPKAATKAKAAAAASTRVARKTTKPQAVSPVSEQDAASDEEVEVELVKGKAAKTPAARSTEKDSNRSGPVASKAGSTATKSDKSSTLKRKLITGNQSLFAWPGGASKSHNNLGIPDMLSPVKKS